MTDTVTKSIEEWKAEKAAGLSSNDAFVLEVMFNIARTVEVGWGVGKVVDEATFDAAIARAGSFTII